MIDFNNAKETINKFSGSELKKTIIYNNEVYMLKFPDPIREKRNSLSYKNNQFSEYIGCKIFESCGIAVQETLLGKYTINDKEKIVIACKDFTQDGKNLIEFSKIANADVISEKKSDLAIENVYELINNSTFITNKEDIISSFWDMFVVDALIGNNDRHFNNWGLIENKGGVSFAPVYDCGSSLSPLLSDIDMEKIINDPVFFKNNEYNARSAYKLNGKSIFYHEIFKSPPIHLAKSIKKIVPKIDINLIQNIITNTPFISKIRANYLINAISLRYENIILPSFKKLSKISVRDKLNQAKTTSQKSISSKPKKEHEI